jgi:phospholipid/cholesterol/gamma-HCH transport system substrate-binding protein
MDERLMAFRIGVTVLATVLAVAILTMILGPQADFADVLQLNHKYTIQIEFEQAPGVRENTPVLKSGIVIGRVASVELIYDGRKALVVARIEEGIKLFDDETCRINRSLLGDSALEFVRVQDKGSGLEIELDGTPLQGEVVSDPLQVMGNMEGNLSEAINTVSEVGGKIGGVIDKLDLVLGSEEEVIEARDRVRRMLDQGAGAMEAIERLANNVNAVIGDPESQQQLRIAFDEIPQVIVGAREFIDSMNQAMPMVEKSLKNVEGFTTALNEEGVQTLERINSTAETLDQTMEEIRLVAITLNTSKGSLGKFINDPELYDSATRTVKSIEQMTPQLRSIMYDIKIITDGMARHPGKMVRDAIRPGAGTKGVPPMSRLRGQAEMR